MIIYSNSNTSHYLIYVKAIIKDHLTIAFTR